MVVDGGGKKGGERNGGQRRKDLLGPPNPDGAEPSHSVGPGGSQITCNHMASLRKRWRSLGKP